MKKILSILTFFSLFFPLAAFCTVDVRCYQDQYGDQYKFSGGKLGSKPYMVQAKTIACGADVAGLATFSQLANGTYLMSAIIGATPAGVCTPFEMDATFDSNATTGTGGYDSLPKNDLVDGAISLTPVNCSLIVFGPVSQQKIVAPIYNVPGKPTK